MSLVESDNNELEVQTIKEETAPPQIESEVNAAGDGETEALKAMSESNIPQNTVESVVSEEPKPTEEAESTKNISDVKTTVDEETEVSEPINECNTYDTDVKEEPATIEEIAPSKIESDVPAAEEDQKTGKPFFNC